MLVGRTFAGSGNILRNEIVWAMQTKISEKIASDHLVKVAAMTPDDLFLMLDKEISKETPPLKSG
jgi:formamidopyrimidine-DNA glycosylase